MGGFSKVIWFLVAPSIVSVVLVQSSAHILVRRIASAWCVVHESREGMCRVLGSGSPARVCRMGDCALLAVEPTGYSDNAQRISSTKFAPYKPPASLLLPLQCDPGTYRALVPSHQQGLRAGPMPGSCGASPQKGVGMKEKQVSSQREQGDWERSQSGDAREQQS